MNMRDRFLAVMEYKPVDRVPNHEVGVWQQTMDRWAAEGCDIYNFHWDWFTGEEAFAMDAREYIPVQFDMVPAFTPEIIEKTDRYEIYRDSKGVTHKALLEGTSRGMRSSMDQYLGFPVETTADFRKLKERYRANLASRYPAQWETLMLPRWKEREHVLVLGRNCSTLGFYWRAREWMGTENLSLAWYDKPALMDEMMEFVADFTIEVSRPILEKTDVDYVFINEDMCMKNGPLLSPAMYERFIQPHMTRLVDFLKGMGARYVMVDTDGNCELLIQPMMDAGVDGIWPLERTADMDPLAVRKRYGPSLRLWGGVDKRELAKGREAIDAHLQSMVPLIEEGGFIPTVDHLVSPDVSYDNFCYYMEKKLDLLQGRL